MTHFANESKYLFAKILAHCDFSGVNNKTNTWTAKLDQKQLLKALDSTLHYIHMNDVTTGWYLFWKNANAIANLSYDFISRYLRRTRLVGKIQSMRYVGVTHRQNLCKFAM